MCYYYDGGKMKSVGIICEYNPFHNGHLKHLSEVKEIFPGYTIILVMSGNFTERGDVSIISKWDKTEIALKAGIDLVIELPFFFASQSADIFARGAIQILNHLKVVAIVFGSESNNVNNLIEMAKITNSKKYDKLVKNYLDDGCNYPTALSKAIYDLSGKKIIKPNDILGLSYIKEIINLNSNIKPISIKRDDNFNDSFLYEDITSSTSIREHLKNNQTIDNQVPDFVKPYLSNKLHFVDDYFNLLKYKILTSINILSNFQTVDEGIQNRFMKFIINSNSYNEFILKIKTKRYTYNRLNRMFIHILCNFTKEDANYFHYVEYIRVLGFNSNGRNYLNKIKKEVNIPIITNYSSIKNRMLNLEFRTTCVYASILENEEATKLIEKEYKNSPIIY